MKVILAQSKTYLTFTLISLIVLVADYNHLFNLPKRLLSYLSVPIQYGLYESSQKTLTPFKFIFAARGVFLENKALKSQLAIILSENSQLRTKLAEAESLLDQENSLSPKTFNLIPARPIGKSRFLIIDKGSDNGVKINQAVVFKDNFIGLVKEVSPKTASVMLNQDPDSKIAVFSQSSLGKAKGVLIGQFGSEALMDKILHSEVINLEDLVYSDGTEGILPRGLIMGKVVEVLGRPNELFKQAIVKSVFDVSDLDLVFIMRND